MRVGKPIRTSSTEKRGLGVPIVSGSLSKDSSIDIVVIRRDEENGKLQVPELLVGSRVQ